MLLSLICACMGLVPVLAGAPCCSPPEYEGWVISSSTSFNTKTKEFKFAESAGKIYFSSRLQRRTVIRKQEDPNLPLLTTINDFRAGKEYHISNGTCKITDLYWPSDDCISGSAKLLKSTNIGNGDDPIDVDVWLESFGTLTHTTTVSRDKCFHLGRTWFGTHGEFRFEGSRMYTNLTEGVTDTSVFDIPAFCVDDPPKCCIPVTYSATILEIGSRINAAKTVQTFIHKKGTFYQDGTNKMQIISEQDDSGSGPRTDMITDFDGHVIYTIKNGQCTVSATNTTILSCIPDDATLVASTFFGSPFAPMKVNIWDFIHDGDQVRLAVTDDGCYPFYDNYPYDFNNVYYNSGYQFSNYKPSLESSDLARFAVPSICNQAG